MITIEQLAKEISANDLSVGESFWIDNYEFEVVRRDDEVGELNKESVKE